MFGTYIHGSKAAKLIANKVFLKCAVDVKYNTRNIMVYGECVMFPPGVTCDLNIVCFDISLINVYSDRLANVVLNELEYGHHNGFRILVTDVRNLSQTYGVENFDMDWNSIKCKALVRRKFIES